jgi:hypothetical protein
LSLIILTFGATLASLNKEKLSGTTFPSYFIAVFISATLFRDAGGMEKRKGRGRLTVVPVHSMNAYGGVKVQLHSF